MNSPKHQKHAKLTRPNYGQFGRNEWAIIGTPCGKIQQLAFALTERLSDNYKVAYVDADHKSADQEETEGRDKRSAMAYGAHLEYTDKISFHRFDTEAKLDIYQFRQYFNELDLVLVNGNHFKAKKQIVVLDPKKEESLSRKLDRLSDIDLILTTEKNQTLYPFLQEALDNWHSIPVLAKEDVDAIAQYLKASLEAALPPLFGLVLAGGKSQRMGEDKGLINYHGKDQREYMADLLNNCCEQTFISCRPEQVAEIEHYPTLPDSISGLGPFGAILSAFRAFPNHAWLVVACDLPLLDASTLAQLKDNRHPSKIATAFNSPVTEFPEPLITIWEPKAYPILLQFLAQGYSCPRKVLINSDVQLLDAANPDALSNVNNPKEKEAVLGILNIEQGTRNID